MEVMEHFKYRSGYSKKDHRIYIAVFESDFFTCVGSYEVDLSLFSSEEADLLLNKFPGESPSYSSDFARELSNYITKDDLPF